MATDPYYDRPEPEKPAAKSLSIAQNVGPLPVWGWGLTIIAAVFLWRRIGGGLTGKTQGAQAVAGPQAPAGSQCPPGYTLIQGPSGYTCATGPQAIDLGKYLQAVTGK